jgi:RsmE family RNA methyltransferase
MNRILLAPDELTDNGVIWLRDRRSRHIRSVLSGKIGDSLRVGVLDGASGEATILATEPEGVQLQCFFDQPPLPSTGVSVLLALPRPKVMRRLWAPLASLGIEHIVLINAGKVERNYFDTHWLDSVNYRPMLIEGLEQSGDTRLPTVRVCRRFKPFVEDELDATFGDAVRLVCHPREAQPLTAATVPSAGAVVVAMGPEGGWTDFEIELLCQHGFRCVSLGVRTLRTDTAVQAILGALSVLRTP